MKKTRWFSVFVAFVLLASALMPAAVAGDSEPAEEPAAEQAQQSETSAEEAAAPAEPEAIITEQSEPAPADEEITVIPPAEEEAPVADVEPEALAQEPEDPAQEEPEIPAEQQDMSEGTDQEAGDLSETVPEERPEEQTPAEELTENQSVPAAGEEDQPAAFEKGYVLIRKQTAAYRNPDKKNVLGTFTADSVAWAVRTTANEDPAKVWLKITFDTEDARKTGTPLFVGYIQQAAVTVLTEEEAGQLSLRLQADPETREENAHGIPVAGFELKQSAGGETAAPTDSKKEEKPGKLAANDGSAGDPEETELKVSVTSVIKKGIGTQITLPANVTGQDANKETELCWEVSKNNGATWNPAEEDAEFTTAGGGLKLVFTVTDRFYDTYRIRCKVRYQAEEGEESKNWVLSNETIFVRPFTAQVSVSPGKAAIGSTVTYTVTPSVKGKFSYQWQFSMNKGKTWGNLKNKTEKTLTRKVKDFEYDYRYRCLVTKISNGNASQIDSTISYVKKKYKVKASASDLSPGIGNVVTLNADVSGAKGTQSYLWQYSIDNGKNWTNSKKTASMTLKIKETTFETQYRCLVSDSKSGTINSNILKFSRPHMPTIACQDNYSAGIGEWLKMKAVTDKPGVIKYVWQVSTDKGDTWTNLIDDETIVNSRKAILSIQVDPDGARYSYQYRCMVTVDSKKINSNILQIKKPLSIKINPSPIPVGIGVTESITVSVGSGFTGAEYRWQLSKDKGKTWVALNNDISSETATIMVNEKLFDKYYKDYRIRCMVTAVKGERTVIVNTKMVSITRPYDVTITSNPEDQKAGIGKKVKFYANTNDTGKKSYQWQYSVDQGNTWTDIQGKTGKTLTIKVPTEDFDYDNYRYRCKVTDQEKGIVYSDGKAKIKRPFSVKTSVVSAVLSEGKTTTFTVNVGGNAVYEWQYSGNGGSTWKFAADDQGNRTKTITIKGDSVHYQRIYRCKVTVNGVSTFSSTIYIDSKEAKKFTFAKQGKYWGVTGYSGNETDVKIPNGYHGLKVVRIKENSFRGNKTIKTVVIPKTVTVIEKSAFEGCSVLTTVTMSDNIEKMGKAAFKNCKKLKNIKINNK